jgi:hypothetical protein
MNVTNYEPIEQLRNAGVPVDKLSDDQRKQLESLSPDEVATISKIKERMGSDVEGYAMKDDVGGIIF